MTLADHYRADMANLKGVERKQRRMHWHHAAKRHLNMKCLTADPIPKPHVDEAGVTTIPFDPFFYQFPPVELIALYRLTKPKRG